MSTSSSDDARIAQTFARGVERRRHLRVEQRREVAAQHAHAHAALLARAESLPRRTFRPAAQHLVHDRCVFHRSAQRADVVHRWLSGTMPSVGISPIAGFNSDHPTTRVEQVQTSSPDVEVALPHEKEHSVLDLIVEDRARAVDEPRGQRTQIGNPPTSHGSLRSVGRTQPPQVIQTSRGPVTRLLPMNPPD